MTAPDRAPAPPLGETDLQAIEQEIASSLAVAKKRYPDATDDQIHTAIHHRDALALIGALRSAWRERDEQLRLHQGNSTQFLDLLDLHRATAARVSELEAERDRYKAFVERVEHVARSDSRGWSDWARIAEAARALLAAPGAGGQHPEATCQRCGGPNISWVTPSALWNGVVGSPNGILCPVCFARAAAEINIDPTWRFEPAPTNVTETWVPGAGDRATEEQP